MIDRRNLNHEQLLILDTWNFAGFVENVFFTEPFRQVLLKSRRTEVHVAPPPGATHTFKVKGPLLAKGQSLCLVGSTPALGNWSTARPLVLDRSSEEDFLSARLDLSQESFPFAYKYGVYDIDRRAFLRYEAGSDRILPDTFIPGKHTIVNDGFVRCRRKTGKAPEWRFRFSVCAVKRVSVSASLRTSSDFPIGAGRREKLGFTVRQYSDDPTVLAGARA